MANYQPGVVEDRVFSALADPNRRTVLSLLSAADVLTVSELAVPLSIQLPTVLKHLGVLDRAGLIERTKTGRVVSVRATPGGAKPAVEWLRRHEHFWSSSLDRLAQLVETDHGDRS